MYNNIKMKMICINPKKNPKLLQTFNNDPYWDLAIVTESGQLHLVLGYLSIDSGYFDEVAPDTKQINLKHLSQYPLIKVLRALYGEQLYAHTVAQLGQLHTIIQFLKINQYKQNIVTYIKSHPQLMDSFQLIQFCFTRHILEEQIRNHHFDLKLSVLASTKNYLQLGKLSQNTLNTLLIQYSEQKGEQADQTINSIIQNYLGRLDLKPNQYFMQAGLESLLNIWEKFHHSISYLITAQQKVRQSQIFPEQNKKSSINMYTSHSAPLPNTNSSPSINIGSSIGIGSNSQLKGFTQGSISTYHSQFQQKQSKIKQLQSTLALKKQISQNLKQQIANIKNQKSKLPLSHNIIANSDEQPQQGVNLYAKPNYNMSIIEIPFSTQRKIVANTGGDKAMGKLNYDKRPIFNKQRII